MEPEYVLEDLIDQCRL